MKGHLKIQLATLVAGLVFVANVTRRWPVFVDQMEPVSVWPRVFRRSLRWPMPIGACRSRGKGTHRRCFGATEFLSPARIRKRRYHLQCLKATMARRFGLSRVRRQNTAFTGLIICFVHPGDGWKRVVVVTSETEAHLVIAYDLAGKKLWEKKFPRSSAITGAGYRRSCMTARYPAGDEDNQSFLAALDAKNGNLIWKVDRINAKAAFSTPCEFTDLSGTKGLVFNSMAHGISFVDPSTGKTLWEQGGLFDKRSVSSSLVAGGLLIGTCGSGGGGNYLVAVKPGNAGKGGKPSLAYKLRLHPLRPHKSGQGQSAFPLERRRHRDLCGGQDREDSLAGTRRGPFWFAGLGGGPPFLHLDSGKVVVIAASKSLSRSRSMTLRRTPTRRRHWRAIGFISARLAT